jgi:hypothetical protein
MENLMKEFPNDQEFGKVIRNMMTENDLIVVTKEDLLNVLFYIKHNTIIDNKIENLMESNNNYHKSIGKLLKQLNIESF